MPLHVPVVLQSDFVEMQAPLFDARFFEWFMDVLGQQVSGMNFAQGHGWGVDNAWCGAAAVYANGTERPHCAIVPVAVAHLDMKVTSRTASASERGVRAVGLTCLLARAAGRRVGGQHQLQQRWTSDPKTTGWFGPDGIGGEGDPALQLRLHRTLLRRASYRTGARCQRARAAEGGGPGSAAPAALQLRARHAAASVPCDSRYEHPADCMRGR